MAATTHLAKLGVLLILARVAHQGLALAGVVGPRTTPSAKFSAWVRSTDDLYAALDDLCARQEKIEQAVPCAKADAATVSLSSSYLEGANWGNCYNRKKANCKSSLAY